MFFPDATINEVNQTMEQAQEAFLAYRKISISARAAFMRSIAVQLQGAADELIKIAAEETHLPLARLRSELTRTCFQLSSYADACEKGDWLQIRKEAADPNRQPARPDIRKMMVPLGPVLVFGAANFPFAYSTAGGDTACALAAGCSVVVKAHPAHAKTSEKVAELIKMAISLSPNIPTHSFQHIHGASHEVGKALVEHPYAKAVGFTGSLAGGRQLFDWAQQRPVPIPVFAEMSSINPIFIFPGKLQQDPEGLAKQIAGSVTLGVGQFCTNPGLLIAPQMPALETFRKALALEIENDQPAEMLHTGIFQNYVEKRANALAQAEVELLATAKAEPLYNQGVATIASTSAANFLQNPVLHREVFGPWSLIIQCDNMKQMEELAGKLEGQLTATLMATRKDLEEYPAFLEKAIDLAGRVVMNGVPTGVEVSQAMMHGGPYPATTDSRFTAVGADGIMRFVRPVAFQNWEPDMLPEYLR
jgi:NADP-dependent aldehyde dehydrogenase